MQANSWQIIPLPFVLLNLESVERRGKITKIWISGEWKELFRWNKKHFSTFLKGYHLTKKNKNLIKQTQVLNIRLKYKTWMWMKTEIDLEVY